MHVKSVDLDNLSVQCRICHKRPTSIPRAVQAGGHGGAHWAPWAYKAFDAAALALKAIKYAQCPRRHAVRGLPALGDTLL